MAGDPTPRSRSAREAAERALVRIIHHYGSRPEFVLLGGLVPELLCTDSKFQHAGTTDVDVQVNLEIASGAVNAARLEQALHNADFVPEDDRIWRWVADGVVAGTVVKFELLADLHDQPTGSRISFDACKNLGAVNLHGTGFASRDIQLCDMSARIGGVTHNTQMHVAGLAGFLLAKTAAAYSRRAPKDWYDIAFVLLHNDAAGPAAAAALVRERFVEDLRSVHTALDDLQANFETPMAQGTQAYVHQMRIDHPNLDPVILAADASVAVREFHQGLRHPVD